jgi:hypothetical protein
LRYLLPHELRYSLLHKHINNDHWEKFGIIGIKNSNHRQTIVAFLIIVFIMSNAPFALECPSVGFAKIDPTVFVKTTMFRVVEIRATLRE